MPTKKVLVQPVATKAVKKNGRKVSGKKSLVYASDAHSFWVTNGLVLNNLVALGDGFLTMNVKEFSHHVSGKKNDFATWVDTVLKDSECASDLQTTKTKTQARAVVLKHLVNYQL